MEATALSLGKSVVSATLGYAKSAIAEEVALQLGVQRDQAFITDELEMIQAFLMTAHDEHDENKVIKAWVKQVRNVAYDVEDCLQDFAVRLRKPSRWRPWRIPRTLLDRRRVAKQMKDLRAKVEDVSQRNVRYRLITGSRSNPVAASAQSNSSIADATKFGIEEAKRQQEKAKVDLVDLIKEDKNLKVIVVWGTNGVLGQTPVIKEAYENPEIKQRFDCRAWVRVMHPFNPKEFLVSILRQFGSTTMLDALLSMGHDDLAHMFNGHVNEKGCLIVLNGLSNIEDWDWIKTYIPDNKNGSRIILSAEQGEIAKSCVGKERLLVSELKQSYTDHAIFAFYNKGSQDGQYSTNPRTNSPTQSTNEILSDQSNSAHGKSSIGKTITRMSTMAITLEESQLVGREKEKDDIIKLILNNQSGQQYQVISVWGMGGLGKTTLITEVYQSQELSSIFEKRASVTVMRPFNRDELLRTLTEQLETNIFERKGPATASLLDRTKASEEKKVSEMKAKLCAILKEKTCLIVLDDLSSTTEWDLIIQVLVEIKDTTRIIVTTRHKSIAEHCSKKQGNVYMLNSLEYKDAYSLLAKKTFKEATNLDEQYPQLAAEAKPILKKCDGLPLAIATIGGFLANQPKTVAEWRKLNENISAELEMNPELETIKTVLLKSYDGLPYHLKSCFLYLSIFPEDYKIGRKRLVRQWVAEGYPREVHGKSTEEIADSYFMELLSRSMILQGLVEPGKGIVSCRVHDLMREIIISKSKEENLVFRLEEGCSINTQGTMRHLAISSSWNGDQREMESMVDMSRIRSLSVFWRDMPFFISEKMRFLRMLSLECVSDLSDRHLEHIGKLLLLKHLYLRGCDIWHLPDSLGNLRQLETLDIRDTQIIELPKSIIKLRRLNFLRVGFQFKLVTEDSSYQKYLKDARQVMPEPVRNKPLFWVIMFFICCAPHIRNNAYDEAIMNRREACSFFCHFILPLLKTRLDIHGAAVPRGVRKLKALHTLGVVNIARGKAVMQDIKGLTQLRKLAVTGVNGNNSRELCSAIGSLSRLESLLVRSEEVPGLQGCLDSISSPPKNLRSLKLLGNLVKLPDWIKGLGNLEKLILRSSRIVDVDAALEVLGGLPNLAILHLLQKPFEGENLCVKFHREAFPSLAFLGLRNVKLIEFEEGAMPKLEELSFVASPTETSIGLLSGLRLLPRLKEFMMDNADYPKEFVEDLQAQLAENPNNPVLKR